MKVVKAKVFSIVDKIEGEETSTGPLVGPPIPASLTRSVKFKVTIGPDYDDNDLKWVTYTSPYFFAHSDGGFITMPPVGSEILLFYDEKANEYFYISTIVDRPKHSGAALSTSTSGLIPDGIYNSANRPQALMMKDAKGAGMVITNQFTNSQEPMINSVLVNSTQGHELLLSDTPSMDCAILRNKDGDGMTITSNKNEAHPSNSIEIKSKGNHKCISYFGEMYMGLIEGRDISIVNHSAGYGAYPLNQYGNVNLVSKWKDINIYCENQSSDQGNVFISTTAGLIQIKAGSDMHIFSKNGNVTLRSMNGDVNLVSNGDINIDSGGSINLRATTSVNISATTTASIAGAAATNVGKSGTPLALNGPANVQPANISSPNPQLNVYNK